MEINFVDITLKLILIFCFFLFEILSTIYFIHMFQLNYYKFSEQWIWIKKNKTKHSALIFPLFSAIVGGAIGHKTGMIIAIISILIATYFYKPIDAKKPLVYTARVKRMLLTLSIIYGLSAILTACLASARVIVIVLCVECVLTHAMLLFANVNNKPIELAINKHYINDAKRIINDFPQLTVIGITGSYGKTSVKHYLNTLLQAKYNVLMTPGNINTDLGVTRIIRNELKATHQIFICEMGAKWVGDIKDICDIVHPKYGVITAVGPMHLESFGSIENIVKTKFELADAIPEDGKVFLNYDCELIRNENRDAITYSLNNDSQYKAKVLSVSENGTDFLVTAPDGEAMEYSTRLIGEHNVLNILAAIAISHELGISLEALRPQVRKLQSVAHRLELTKRGNLTIIDDSYNSNPSGTKAALDTLHYFDSTKVLVTPGMVELGEKQEELNFEFGTNAAKVCDYVALVGKKQTQSIYDGLIKSGFNESNIKVADTLKEALNWVYAIKSDKKKTILLENDLPDNY